MQRRVFYRWLIALAAIWVLANLPRSYGLAGFFTDIGFPFVVVSWWGGKPSEFSFVALLLDGVIGIIVVVGLPFLCAWSRRKSKEVRATPNQPQIQTETPPKSEALAKIRDA